MTTLDELLELVPSGHQIMVGANASGEVAPDCLPWVAFIRKKHAKNTDTTHDGSGTTAIEAMQNALYTYNVSREKEQ